MRCERAAKQHGEDVCRGCRAADAVLVAQATHTLARCPFVFPSF